MSRDICSLMFAFRTKFILVLIDKREQKGGLIKKASCEGNEKLSF